MTHALITGGAGFIGRHLVQYLLNHTDWHLTLLDSLTYATQITPRFRSPRVTLHYHDLRAIIHEELTNRIGPIELIFNVASESHVDRSITNPVPFVLNNTQLALNMLEYARQAKPTHFFQISTDEVYGPAPNGYSFREWDTHLPSNPYAASKSAQESIAISYWRTYNVPIVITNTMNNFGPTQHPEKFIPKTIKALTNDQPITIHGEVRQGQWVSGSRCWLHADNHASALHFLATNHKPQSYPKHTKPSRFHIAGDEEVSNLDMAHRLAAILKRKARIEWENFHQSRPGHDLRYALDGSKLRNLGWTPPMPLMESLEATVRAYNN